MVELRLKSDDVRIDENRHFIIDVIASFNGEETELEFGLNNQKAALDMQNAIKSGKLEDFI